MTQTVTLELVVTDGVPNALATRLDRLCATGVVDEYTARTPETADELLDHYRDWAHYNGVSFRSFVDLDRAEESSLLSDALRLPPVVLAEYHDGDLHFVAPCEDRETVYTVLDRIRDLTAQR
jgi:hypothetical protein